MHLISLYFLLYRFLVILYFKVYIASRHEESSQQLRIASSAQPQQRRQEGGPLFVFLKFRAEASQLVWEINQSHRSQVPQLIGHPKCEGFHSSESQSDWTPPKAVVSLGNQLRRVARAGHEGLFDDPELYPKQEENAAFAQAAANTGPQGQGKPASTKTHLQSSNG